MFVGAKRLRAGDSVLFIRYLCDFMSFSTPIAFTYTNKFICIYLMNGYIESVHYSNSAIIYSF